VALLLSPAEYIDMVVYTLYVDRGWKSGVKHSQATVISDQPWSSISTPRKVICNNQCEIGARRRCHGGKIKKRGDSYLCTTRINTKNKQMYKKDSGWVGVCAAVVVGVGAGVVLIVDSRERERREESHQHSVSLPIGPHYRPQRRVELMGLRH